MLCGLAGAFCDVMENIHIFRALAGQSVTPRYWSLTKWTLIFVTLALLSRVYRTAGEPPLRRFIGFWATFFSILAAVIGLGEIVLKTDPMIESAGNFLGLSLFAGCLFFFTKEPLKTGLCPFLDRVENFQIGGYHPLRRLAEWPSDDVSNDPK